MRTTSEHLIGALRVAGLRVTLARRVICKVLAEAPEEHLSAADILSRAAQAAGEIDQSTVYRTLDVLEELGFLHHVHLGHGPGVYHLSKQAEHHHLVCEDCGRAVDIPLEDLGPALERVTLRYGFVPDSLHFAILGRCSDCAG
ncbi:MAG: transcriptional repressor [Actinomycetota bacterium]|nr:transcriptional repressor [Actinomycetota bacterium]